MNEKTSNKIQAIIFVLLAGFSFALMNLMVKLAGDIPVFEKSFFRNLIAAIIALLSLTRGQKLVLGAKENVKYLLIRSICGTVGIVCNYYAIDHMIIANASMFNRLSPFFALIFSYLVLKEKVSLKQFLCILLAFVGVLFILKPSTDLIATIPSLIGLLGGLGAGIAYTYVRVCKLKGVSSTLIILAFSLFSCIVSGILMIPSFTIPSSSQLLFLILAGFAAAGGQFSITAAYGKAPARELAVFEYNQIIFSAIFGFFILSELPDGFSFVGYIIIILASWIMYRYNPKKSL